MRINIDVRFSEVDSQGHANHTAIISWLAHCRVKMIDEAILQSGWEDLDHVLVGLSVNFRKEVFYPDRIEVEGRFVSTGNTSVVTAFHAHRGNDTLCDAVCTNIFFNSETKASVDIPSDLRKLLTSN